MTPMPNNELNLLERTLTLIRYPERSNDELQAWDAGDEYLIRHVESLNLPPNQRILILNDHFGALAAWFSERHQVISISDSMISIAGAKRNLERNNCQKVELRSSIEALPQDIDLVLIQIPKNNRYLSWQLTQLRQYLSSSCPVVSVNKVKDIHLSTLALFERYLGTTTTSLAWKKHRLVFTTPNLSLTERANESTQWTIDEEGFTINNLTNVFSAESLDIGARFFLSHIPADPSIEHIIDLGCGNGVLSVKAAQLNPQAKISSVDESYMAVESAKINLYNNLSVDKSRFNCIVNNCLDDFDAQSADLVLCNPPFHQQHTITDHIAWQMFCDAKHVLKIGGRLLVIGNRHLRYDVKLVRLFGKAQLKTVAANHKFVILQAIKR
jgi:16S rRNA (guanine1207-N2)-methyltransferase